MAVIREGLIVNNRGVRGNLVQQIVRATETGHTYYASGAAMLPDAPEGTRVRFAVQVLYGTQISSMMVSKE